MNYSKSIPLTVLAFGLVQAAHAGGSNLGTAGSFNAFIFGSATVVGAEAEGAIAVGGIGVASGSNAFTATGNYNTVVKNDPGTVGTLTKVGLYVNGNAQFQNGGQLNNGANAYVSGKFTTTNPYDLNGGGALYYGTSLTGTVQGGSASKQNLVNSSVFSTQLAYSEAQTAALNALPQNASFVYQANNWNLNIGTHATPTTYVVDMTAAELAGYGGNSVTLGLGHMTAADTLVIDVSGTAVSTFGVSVNGGLQSRILWNFSSATSIDINNRALEGSILAPYATVDQGNLIEGTLIAKNWNMTSANEIHSYNFTGNIAAVPEPCPTALFGLSALGIVFRKLRKKARA